MFKYFEFVSHRLFCCDLRMINFINPCFYRFLKNIQDLMSVAMFFQLVFCVLCIALVLFAVDEADKLNTALLFDIEAFLVYNTYTFLCCSMSENLTEKSGNIGNVVYNVAWFNMTANEKQAIWMVISRTKNEYHLNAMGLFDCSFASYLQVYTFFFSKYMKCSKTHFCLSFLPFFLCRVPVRQCRFLWFFVGWSEYWYYRWFRFFFTFLSLWCGRKS